MKAIDGIELQDLSSTAKAALLEAQKNRLVVILTKMYEERDTLKVTVEKSEASLKKQKEQLAQLEEKLLKIEAGDWNLIKEDGKGQAQVQGGEDKKSDRPEQKPS